MKNIYSLLCFMGFAFISNAQIITIPDANFKAKLTSGNNAAFNIAGNNFNGRVDANNDGEIQLSEAQAVTGLDLRTNFLTTTGDLTSLAGIENFTNLKYLQCLGNNITNLDLSMLQSLEYLGCSNNNMISLNISGMGQLKEVTCNNNMLSTLNTTGLNSLEKLFCHVNNLSTISLTTMPALKSLKISDNNLTSMDATVLPDLQFLVCSGNQISQLNIANMTTLKEVVAGNNNLSQLDLTGLSQVNNFDISSNNFTTLNLAPLTSLWRATLSNNPFTAISVSNNTMLQQLFIENTLIQSIDCSQTDISQLFCNNSPNLQSININNGIQSHSDPDMLYLAFRFENLPALTNICMDNGEQNNLLFTNYNSSGNVNLFTGPNCNVPLFLGLEENKKASLKIHPNPASSFLNIEGAEGLEKATIYNMLGQAVKITSLRSNTHVDVSTLANGTYMVKVDGEAGSATKKFVKN